MAAAATWTAGRPRRMLHYRPDITTVSPPNSLYGEGPPSDAAEVAVVVGFDEPELDFCDSLVVTRVIDNGLDLDLDLDLEEQGDTVWLCRIDVEWNPLWPQLRHIG